MAASGSSSNYRTLRLILGDQLDIHHHWFEQQDDEILYLIAELRQEASYVMHHVQKLCAFFAAMQQFAAELDSRGHDVLHLTLDETDDYENLVDLIEALCNTYAVISP